jgi:hypothetical protein
MLKIVLIFFSEGQSERREGQEKKPAKVYTNVLDRFKTTS